MPDRIVGRPDDKRTNSCIVIQSNINAFWAYLISGHGAYAKIEGFVFLPIMSVSMVLLKLNWGNGLANI